MILEYIAHRNALDNTLYRDWYVTKASTANRETLIRLLMQRAQRLGLDHPETTLLMDEARRLAG